MIIFDLDGTLADCEHRRHFVEAPEDNCNECYSLLIQKPIIHIQCCKCKRYPTKWKPDWKSFYEACDQDSVISPVWHIFLDMKDNPEYEIQIWSGRCESVRKKTVKWLNTHLLWDGTQELKMRPIGDSTPDFELKERWLDELLAMGQKIDFVFDSDPFSIEMWRRRGVFVFNCLQIDGEF